MLKKQGSLKYGISLFICFIIFSVIGCPSPMRRSQYWSGFKIENNTDMRLDFFMYGWSKTSVPPYSCRVLPHVMWTDFDNTGPCNIHYNVNFLGRTIIIRSIRAWTSLYEITPMLTISPEYKAVMDKIKRKGADTSKESFEYLKRGNQLFLDGQNEKAVQEWQKAVELDPRATEAKYRIGYSYFIAGKYNDAQRVLEEYTTLVTDDVEAKYLLVRVYFFLGAQEDKASSSKSEAEFYYKKASELCKETIDKAPTHELTPYAKLLLDSIVNLKDSYLEPYRPFQFLY